VSSRPLDASGFRGAVVLKAGYYRMATPLLIQASGVVLRGEGMSDTGTILIGTGTGRVGGGGGAGAGAGGNQGTLVLVGGAAGITINAETKQTVVDALQIPNLALISSTPALAPSRLAFVAMR